MSGQFFTNKKEEGKMKKLILALVIGSFMVGTAFAQTYKEEYSAGMAKYVAGDYAGALPIFQEALKLATTGIEKSGAQLFSGHCYYMKNNFPVAKIEYAKVLIIENARPTDQSKAQLGIGYCDYREGNYSVAKVAFAKTHNIKDGSPQHKSAAMLYEGYCCGWEGNIVEAQEAYIKTCKIRGAAINDVKAAFNQIDKVALGREEYCHLLIEIIINLNADRDTNAGFIATLASKFDGEIGLGIVPDRFDKEGNPVKDFSAKGMKDRYQEVFSEEYK